MYCCVFTHTSCKPIYKTVLHQQNIPLILLIIVFSDSKHFTKDLVNWNPDELGHNGKQDSQREGEREEWKERDRLEREEK